MLYAHTWQQVQADSDGKVVNKQGRGSDQLNFITHVKRQS